MRNQGSEVASSRPSTPHYALGRLSNIHGDSQQSGMLDAAFFQEISEVQEDIRKVHQQIDVVARLHARQIDAVNLQGNTLLHDAAKATEDARALSTNIKSRIHLLRSLPTDSRSRAIRNPQLELVRTRFLETIDRFQNVERDYRDRSKDRIARQVKIVNPEATSEEIEAIARGGENVQVFAHATLGVGEHYAQGTNVRDAVSERQREIRRVESQLLELAQLFNDMSVLVEQQQDDIDRIHEVTEKSQGDIEKGKVALDKGVIHALAYRKGRWICFILLLIVIVVLAVGITCGVSDKC